VLNQRGTEGLAVIEWNTKTKTDSAKINRAYSNTTIGIIDKALDESIGNRKRLMEYLLNLEEVKDALYPNVDDEMAPDYPVVKWGKFALGQKNIIETQVKNTSFPVLIRYFLAQ